MLSLGGGMATATEVSCQIGKIDNVYGKGGVPAIEDENCSSEATDLYCMQSAGKPPRNTSGMRHCISTTRLVNIGEYESDIELCGPKAYMEDEHVCIDHLREHFGSAENLLLPGAFYGVFDGHGGTDAASFTRKNILKFIVEDTHFPASIKKAVRNAFVKADQAFADTSSLDTTSGTTVLTALVLGRNMLVANAGDSRAVLGKRGRAVELSKDHKPNCTSERQRIEKLGGVVCDGYLNGQLSVARALGDWHLKGLKGSSYPLSCEPELQEIELTEEDEFLIIGCDGLWDVMSSQYAVTTVRKELMQHNDPERCCRELIKEALRRNTCDNLTVVVVCFSSDPPPPIEIPNFQRRRSISAEGIDLLKGILNNL
ncbi:hypothetical protein Nepgr_008453 [Nepenthes gracilis]|uniref:protein-serine/threonine phosphatase n=1 Tax=Nepenthes gracilis TaxID=150966 RepID=A0AAD3XJA1_NEPGR|nr:hypothetical protein Nepgr_008453 [Nepenthes gracilis]